METQTVIELERSGNEHFISFSIILLATILPLLSLGNFKPEKAREALSATRTVFPAPRGPSTVQDFSNTATNAQWDRLREVAKDANALIESNGPLLQLTYSADLLFQDGDDELYPKGRETLRRLARAIPRNSLLEVEVHTDNFVRLSARFPSLWTLSIQRAETVYALMRAEGIRENHIRAAGFASGRPAYSNVNEDSRSKNRRIVFRFLQEEQE